MKTPARNFRVDIDGVALTPFCTYHAEAKRAAEFHSRQLNTTATVVRLAPTYAVLETYVNGKEVQP